VFIYSEVCENHIGKAQSRLESNDKEFKYNIMSIFGCIISASLSINTASVSANGVELSPSPSVGLCVCECVCVGLESSERGRSRDGLLDAGGDRRRRGCFSWEVGEFGAPIVNNGDFIV